MAIVKTLKCNQHPEGLAEVPCRAEFVDWAWPVGSVYQTYDIDFDPNTAWGGTWERIQGKFLFAADSSYPAGSNGGSDASSLPAHTHTTPATYTGYVTSNHVHLGYHRQVYKNGGSYSASTASNIGSGTANQVTQGISANHQHLLPAMTTSSAGSAGATSNRPAFVAVNTWRRTE